MIARRIADLRRGRRVRRGLLRLAQEPRAAGPAQRLRPVRRGLRPPRLLRPARRLRPRAALPGDAGRPAARPAPQRDLADPGRGGRARCGPSARWSRCAGCAAQTSRERDDHFCAGRLFQATEIVYAAPGLEEEVVGGAGLRPRPHLGLGAPVAAPALRRGRVLPDGAAGVVRGGDPPRARGAAAGAVRGPGGLPAAGVHDPAERAGGGGRAAPGGPGTFAVVRPATARERRRLGATSAGRRSAPPRAGANTS